MSACSRNGVEQMGLARVENWFRLEFLPADHLSRPMPVVLDNEWQRDPIGPGVGQARFAATCVRSCRVEIVLVRHRPGGWQPVVAVLLTEMGPMVVAEGAPRGPTDLSRWASAD